MDVKISSESEKIIVATNNGSNHFQGNSVGQSYRRMNRSDESGEHVWQCAMTLSGDYIESAVSSSDESSPHKKTQVRREPEAKQGCSNELQEADEQNKKVKKIARKNYGRVKVGDRPSNLEDSAQEVRKRFEMGCECTESCFRGLNPEAVYKHRLNIAELTKEEHDMYLMGVTMACMSDPVSTNKRRERRRARPNYAYSGRRVCLAAFLYLENVTLYQLKRIRKHVMTDGVTARIHGNHGKKPHNVFPLDIYRRATTFLKDFIQQHNVSGNPKGPIILPPDVTRKSVHNCYKDYVHRLSDEKILGYSTFRHFMKEQFPNLRFSKCEIGSAIGNNLKGAHGKQFHKNLRIEDPTDLENGVNLKSEISSHDIQVSEIPVILAEPSKSDESRTIIVTPFQLVKRKDMTAQAISILPDSSFTFTSL